MKAIIKRLSAAAVSLMLALALTTSCDSTSVNEIPATAPVIEDFSPVEGYAGCQVTVTGTGLNNVTRATVGGVDADIVQRISDSRIIIRVPAMATTGQITLSNMIGSGTSEANFTMSYPAPVVDRSTLPGDVELSANMLIFGQRMSVITKVLFSAAGYEPHQAEIMSQTDTEIVVKVPYVEADDAGISFEYFNGSALTTTSASDISVKVARFEPKVSSVSASEATIGDIITLEGEYLDKVGRVLVGEDGECMITLQTPSQLRFVVPELDSFIDGDNFTSLAIEYFDGVERKELHSNFKVKVPLLLFWADRKVWAQGRDVEEFTSFFSPQTGIAYANAMWRTLDWVSYQNQDRTCSAAQVPAVSADDYNAVPPYFFFTGVNAGNLQINSPAGSASMLKNIFTENNSANDYRVTGANGNCYGTPVLTFLALDENTAAHAALIDKVRTNTLERLDEETYPLDVDKKRVGDISISGVSNSLNDTKFAPGVFTVGKNLDTDVDAYILVLYYNEKGLNSSNRAENVRRMGVLHIKHIDFRTYNNTDAPSSSSITFDMYWMKHDYKN